MSTEIQGKGDGDAYVVVPCTIINSASCTLTLDDASQIKSQRAEAAPSSISSGKTVKFTMSPHDELKYVTGEGDDAHFKIKFDDDDDHPKLKLGDAYDSKKSKIGVETTTIERKKETETKVEEEKSVTRSTGDPLPESKVTKETEDEWETGTIKNEVKTKTKTEQSKKGKKITKVEKRESKEKTVEITWEIYSA